MYKKKSIHTMVAEQESKYSKNISTLLEKCLMNASVVIIQTVEGFTVKLKLSDPEEINRVLYPSVELVEYRNSLESVIEADVDFYREQGYLAVQKGYSEQTVEDSKNALMDMLECRRQLSRAEFEALMQERRYNAGEGETAFEQEESKKMKLPFIQITKGEDKVMTEMEFELATRKIADFVNYDARLHAAAFHPEVIRVVEMLLGAKAKLVQDMALLKPPQGGGEKPWHQDMAYRGLDYDRAIVGVWIALDDAGVDNGCMHVIPRSHMRGGVPHYAVRDWQMCDENVDPDRAFVAPLTPGGILFFHGMLHHGTPSNFTTKRRRALQFHYAPVSAEWVTSKEYKRMFTNEMSGAQC